MNNFDCPVCHCTETHVNITDENGKRKDWLLALKNPALNSVCVLRMCKNCGVVQGTIEPFDTSETVNDKERAIANHVLNKEEATGASITKDFVDQQEDEDEM